MGKGLLLVSAHSGDNDPNKVHGCKLTLLGIVGLVRILDNPTDTCNGAETAVHWPSTLPTPFPRVIGDMFTSGGGKFTNTDFSNTAFGSMEFNGTDFSNTTFEDTYFYEAHFSAADLTDTNFDGSTFQTSGFYDSDLTGATFVGADTSGISWSNTTCPDGTDSDNNGNTCVGHLVP